MRWLAALLVACAAFAAPARAAPATPCPHITIGWALQYPPPITAVLYGQDALILYVIFNSVVASAFSGVPTSVMQLFSQSKNPSLTYQTYVLGRYHAMLLFQANNCPLLFENGRYFWTD